MHVTMEKPARKFVVGNWKMHGNLAALPVLGAIDAAARETPAVDVGVAVPATLITAAWQTANAIHVGAQDIHPADKGAHTGCLSAPMVKDAGAAFTIVGHSECRAGRQESDDEVRGKAEAARRHGLSVILCVGEPLEVREAGQAEAVVRAQLENCLPADADGAWLSVAYEPIWAIGTGRSATQDDIAAMHAVLRETCRAALGPAGDGVRLLYGGSVTPANAAEILATPNVDGVLVGGASLTAETFLPIIAHA
ncbi:MULTISPECIES: triose-phosphate isomerase [Caulobacter]|jgi:triosephosphate isomerase|uniref:Triosephosphate isomerase n=1 Tax=Caulobacter rhizosphaerae TaxID=2010972 RepID=A0ABU1MY45_9CAUL|nr:MULTISPECIES: triose-phosphate isomerase [Caulobacter]MDR6531100.1 triosephosphate isomerase [Caulobacter rhizosphaerae]GGL26083.1 triosephosphate isomerase [Caulobacter rhizosphaerae]